MFADATYQLNQNMNINLRKQSQLPLEEDVQTFKKYVLDSMNKILLEPFNFFDSSSYVELRDCACSRLTLLTATQGKKKYFKINCTLHYFLSHAK